MRPGHIPTATRVLGKPEGWDESKLGDCESLAILDSDDGIMISEWHPDAADLSRLMQGAPIYLSVVGTKHPPVALLVGEPTHEGDSGGDKALSNARYIARLIAGMNLDFSLEGRPENDARTISTLRIAQELLTKVDGIKPLTIDEDGAAATVAVAS